MQQRIDDAAGDVWSFAPTAELVPAAQRRDFSSPSGRASGLGGGAPFAGLGATPAAPAAPAPTPLPVGPATTFDPNEVTRIIQTLDPVFGQFWAERGHLVRAPLTTRPDATLAISSGTSQPKVAFLASYPSEVQKALWGSIGHVWVVVPESMTSMAVAQYVVSQIRSHDGAVTEAPSADIQGLRAVYEQYVSARQAAGTPAQSQSPMEELRAYLDSISTEQRETTFLQVARKVFLNYDKATTVSLTDMPAFAKGFAKGFFIEGALGNITGIKDLAVLSWQAAKLRCYFDEGCEYAGRLLGYDFAAERAFAETILKVGLLAYEISEALDGAVENTLARYYRLLTEQNPAELKKLDSQNQKVKVVLFALAVKISDEAANIAPETKGNLFSQVVWEVSQTLAELLFTGGTVAVVSKSVKFARLADKLADLARHAERFGELAEIIRKLARHLEEGGDLRQLFQKLDDAGTGNVGDGILDAVDASMGAADEAFESLAQLRRDLGLPAATTDDAFTLSRLDIDGHSFFGINGGVANSDDAARTLQQLAAELGRKGPTFQLFRHAEGDALLQAFNRGVGQGKRATLYVDNLFICQGCKSGLNNMRRLLVWKS